MNVALWIIAGLLALFFVYVGATKLFVPKDKLAVQYPFAADLRVGTIWMIGVLEVLAAVGLILPAALDIAPILVPLAALGLAVLMVGAVIVHLRRKEVQTMSVPIVLFVLAVVVAWGRFGPESFVG